MVSELVWTLPYDGLGHFVTCPWHSLWQDTITRSKLQMITLFEELDVLSYLVLKARIFVLFLSISHFSGTDATHAPLCSAVQHIDHRVIIHQLQCRSRVVFPLRVNIYSKSKSKVIDYPVSSMAITIFPAGQLNPGLFLIVCTATNTTDKQLTVYWVFSDSTMNRSDNKKWQMCMLNVTHED